MCQNMVKLFILSCLLFFNIRNCWAVDADYATIVQNLNFGTFVQTAENAQIVLDYNGSVVSSSGVSFVKNGNAAYLTYKAGQWSAAHTIYMPENLVTSAQGNGCTITVNNYSFSEASLYFFIAGVSHDVTLGATLNINGWCLGNSGSTTDTTYSLTQIIEPSANLGYNVDPANLIVSFVIEEKIAITNKQDLNFGSMMSPSADSTVVVSYDGQRTANGGIFLMDNTSVSNAIFTIEGQIGRTVQLSLPNEILIYNEQGNALTVNNFISNRSPSFVLDTSTVDALVGASLNVPRNSPVGDYSGSYTVTVSY